MQRFFLLPTLIVSLSLGLLTHTVWAADPDLGAEFSADSVNLGPKGQSVSSKMFVGKNGTRKEFSQDGKQVVEIMNRSKQVAWMLFEHVVLDRVTKGIKDDAVNRLDGIEEQDGLRRELERLAIGPGRVRSGTSRHRTQVTSSG